MASKIDNANAVILQICDEQTLTLQIQRHVINAASHVAERYLDLKLQWECDLLLSHNRVGTE
jgi:hypothetical protein